MARAEALAAQQRDGGRAEAQQREGGARDMARQEASARDMARAEAFAAQQREEAAQAAHREELAQREDMMNRCVTLLVICLRLKIRGIQHHNVSISD